MTNLNSLPDTLRKTIEDAARGAVSTDLVSAERTSALVSQNMDSLQGMIVELARQSPELFVALLIASLGFTGVQTVESDETRGFQRVTSTIHGDVFDAVVPTKVSRTIRREVRFVKKSQPAKRKTSTPRKKGRGR